MPTLSSQKKYILPAIGVGILCILVITLFYALLFGKSVFQGSIEDMSGGKGVTVQFDIQGAKELIGISGQQ
jgi:hypothetical protein